MSDAFTAFAEDLGVLTSRLSAYLSTCEANYLRVGHALINLEFYYIDLVRTRHPLTTREWGCFKSEVLKDNLLNLGFING